ERGVTGEQDQGVVLAAERQAHQVDGDRDIDALLDWRLRWPVAVVELAADHPDAPVAGPVRGLCLVRGRRLWLMIGMGLPPVHADRRGHAGPGSPAGEEGRDLGRVAGGPAPATTAPV